MKTLIKILCLSVLGLFAVGCEEGWNVPMGPIGGTGCEDGFCEKWECPTTGYIYNDEDFCEDRCSEECIEREE